MKALVLFLLTIFAPNLFAFPEMIRQHYANCIACHEAPSGGGILNPYGRSISAEVLSTWGDVKEARPLYGAVDHPFLKDWFNLGGDLRAIQVDTENSKLKQGRFIRMQTGLETSLKYKTLKLVSFFGKQEEGDVVQPDFLRFFLLYHPLDELTLRAGRFIPNFGINIAEHIFATRRGLGFDEGSERDQLEVMWSGEKWNSSLTYSKQVPTDQDSKSEKGISAQVNYNLFDSYKIGGDLWIGNLENQHRVIYGAHALLGFTKKFYYLTEFDLQNNFENKDGLFHFSKLGYEIIKGVHAIAIEDYAKSDFNNSLSLSNSYGVGLEWYPRPHIDLEGVISKKRIAIEADEYTNYSYLMMHYYF